LPRFFRLYDESGARELQSRILGNLIGYFTSEIGTINQTVHLWGYSSLDDRMGRRAALMKEPVWQTFLAEAVTLIQLQESKILLPTAFSPVGGRDAAQN
jgi:hypothetical protein